MPRKPASSRGLTALTTDWAGWSWSRASMLAAAAKLTPGPAEHNNRAGLITHARNRWLDPASVRVPRSNQLPCRPPRLRPMPCVPLHPTGAGHDSAAAQANKRGRCPREHSPCLPGLQQPGIEAALPRARPWYVSTCPVPPSTCVPPIFVCPSLVLAPDQTKSAGRFGAGQHLFVPRRRPHVACMMFARRGLRAQSKHDPNPSVHA